VRPYSAGEIARITGGRIILGGPRSLAKGVSIDSRKVREGDLFCAIKGDRADGHDFIGDVVKRGASCALVERPVELSQDLRDAAVKTGFAIVLVRSTVEALGLLASRYRSELDLTVIGITGSVGKTSTKDLTHAVLSRRFTTYKNPGNLNSHIGLPLAVLGMEPGHEYAVLEMAMRKRGEIRQLGEIAGPKYGILTDISVSHIGILGSLEEIALAKAELLESLPQDGLAILAGDNQWVRKMSSHARCPFLYYGLSEDSDIRGFDVTVADDGTSRFAVSFRDRTYRFTLSLPGAHQVENALAAIGFGLYLGLSDEEILAGLSGVILSPMRLEVVRCNRITIINDAYNASPKSMKAALDLLSKMTGKRKVAVLGDMLEMGAYGPEAHREVGQYASSRADLLVAVGDLGRYIKSGWEEGTVPPKPSSWFSDRESARDHLGCLVEPGDTVLVKASRGMGFESLAEYLRALGGSGGGER